MCVRARPTHVLGAVLGFIGFSQTLDNTPYVSFCGHLLHMSCRDKYLASLLQQRLRDPYAELKLEDVENGEFTYVFLFKLDFTLTSLR